MGNTLDPCADRRQTRPLYRMMRKSWDQPERQAYDLPRLLLLNREQSPVQTEIGSVKRKMQGEKSQLFLTM